MYSVVQYRVSLMVLMILLSFSQGTIFTFRYKAACFACSLEQDFKILPNGDQTEVT